MVDAEGQAQVIEQDINERMARFAPSQAGPDVDPIAAEIAARASIPSAQPTMQEASGVDPVAMQIATRHRESLNAAVLGARSVNPDEATRAEQLGQRIGIGPEIARADMARAEQQAYLMDLRAKDYPRTDPILANYLENRQFAETAHDDLGMLEMVKPILLEAAMIQARGAPALFDAVSRGYERGKKQMELGEMQALGMVRFPTPQEREDIANLTKEIQALGRGGAVGTGAEMIGQYAANLKEIGAFSAGGAAVGSLIPGVGTAVGGGLGLAAGLLKTAGTPTAGNLYNTLNEKGVSDDVAIPAAIAGGFLTGLVEVVGGKIAAMPVQALAKRVMAETLSDALTRPTLQQAAKEFVKAYGLQVGGEAFEEGTQAISEMLTEEIALASSGLDSELTMREGFMRVIESALYGAAGASILGGVGPGANLLIDLRRASNTERQAKVFEDLAANRKESKYANRNPVGYERFLAAQAEGTTAETIYVDGRIAQQVLAQSGVPTAQLEEILPGIRERISEAVQTGGDVTIPTARFGARLANTELGNALLPHMRLSPDAMSATEAQEFATRRQDVVREAEQILAQKQEADATFVQQARQIEDTLASQIVATGQMDEKAARSSAQFMRDFYVTQAAALGMSPQQLYERFPVRVEGAMPAAAAPIEQATRMTFADVEQAFAELGVEQRLTETDTAIRPGIIRVPENLQRQGRATKAMQSLFAYADQVGKRIDISPTSEFGMSKKRLVEWYKRLGFVENKGRNKDFSISATMYRAPVQAAPGVMEQASTPSQIDAQHRDAIKAGDIATAQALTDAAAEERMPDSQVRDVDGKIMRVFHGTQRIDRIGNRLLKKRATSGPMPFFTNTRPIAEGYAQGKEDTSIEDIGYEQWIKYKPKGSRSRVTLDQAWLYLTPEQRATATERLFTVGYQNPDEGTGPIVADTDTIASRDHVQYMLREARGNALTAAKELWLNSGTLFNDEQQFMDVLKGMGLTEGFVYDSPHAVNSGIVEAYINITNPLDTAAIPESVVDALQQRANRIRKPAAQYGRDAWDKEVREPQAWMQRLRDDISEGQTQAWTSIPDWVTDVLRRLGYDGIKDTGGKFGGEQHTVWIPFEPEQVKFANAITKDASGRLIPLSERFDLTSPMMYRQEGLLEQAPVTPGFYSALEREVGAIDAKALTASGWNERFKGLISKGAIKADELEWSGLADYLKMQEGKVSKDAVLEFLRGNGVRVERVAMGASPADLLELRNALARAEDEHDAARAREDEADRGDDEAEALAATEAANQTRRAVVRAELALKDAERTKYASYTLPGGTNYREVLLTLPREDRLPVGYSLVQQDDKWRIADSSGNLVRPNLLYGTTKESAIRNAIAYLKAGQLAPTFQSTHWDQLNVLVHLRMNDRVDADGKRVLFVEEVQSDWGQAGREKGFARAMLQSLPEGTIVYQKGEHPTETNVAVVQLPTGIGGRSMFYGDTVEQATAAALAFTRPGSVQRAPFVETTDGWLNLGLKQVLLEAVRGNYDRVAFVNGQQSADRYDLSKQVDRIVVAPRAGVKRVNIELKAGNILSYGVDANGIISETTEESMRIAGAGTPLENVIGKELSEKIMQTERGTFEGGDLKVGGKGMVEFYDKIVPIAMGKLLKKYGGGKLGQVGITEQGTMRNLSVHSDGTQYWLEFNDGTRASGNVASYLEADAIREQLESGISKQPGFDITPEMVTKLESGLPLFQAAAAPGPRGGFDPKRLTTILNKTADLSTFLHESAHAFLTFYEQVAATPDAPARIVNDMDELLRWFKIDGTTPAERIANWNGLTLDQKRKYHETFAYNFEVYLFDGKAPSTEMQGMFERFSAWLKRVYRSIRDDLNAIYRREFGEDLPILTGEVRQVMDRMLATDEQIKRQAAINEMKPQFQTQEQSGMDDAEWAAYQAMQQEAIEASVTDMNKASMRQLQWLGNARSRILRDMQRKHDAKRKEVAAEVAAELRVEPVYRAMTYLRTGKFIDADGAEVTVEGPHRLDTKRVQAIYENLPTEKAMEAVRATGMAIGTVFAPDIAKLGTGKYGMLGVDGLDPDVVAETFGYSSGDQMIRALLAAKPMKEAVAERTDAEMLRRFGDMNTPEAQEAEVQKALHNEARARFVAVELRYIARATEPVRVMVEAAKQVARDLIANTTVRDVRPADFIAAEARAARDAGRMGTTINPAAVGQAAQTRAYNEAIEAGTDPAEAMAAAIEKGAEAARKAQERSDALKAQYGADPQQALIRAKRAQLYQNQLAAEALRVREEVAKQVKYLRRILRDTNVKAMGAQAADQIAGLLERFEVAPVSLKRLDERKALAAWLAEQEAAGLVPDIAPEVADEARRVNYQQLTVAEFRDLVDAIRQIEFIGKNERKVQLAAERAAYEETRDEIVTRIRAVGRLRGVKFDPRSPLTNIGRSAAALRGFAAQHLKAASVARILDGGEDDGPLWTFAIRSANAASDMETRMRAEASAKLAEILAPVFALGNMGGKGVLVPSINRSLNREARLAIAMNVGNDGNRQRLLDGEGWTMEQVQPVLESLTEAEWQAVQKVWDYIDTYRPLIAEKERRLYGKEPEWVKPTPFTTRTADGREVRLEGGYYPIKYDPIASDRVATVDEAAEAKRALDGAYTAATTRRSFVKSRVREVVGRPLLYTLDAAFGGINDVIHDLSWHEWLIQTQRLLRDPEFANAVRETRGPEYLKQLRDWAKDNAAGERKIGVAGEAALSWLRQGISASGLGFNVVSAAMQVTGFNQSIVSLGAKYVGRGVAQFAGSPIITARMVADKSSFMAERGRTQFREINEIRNRVRGQTEVARRVTSGTYFLMMNMQRTVDIPTWLAGYQKALDAGKDDATAVALADQAVRDTQGSGLISDLAAIERGGPVMKLFTVFYSYMNTVYNMTAVQTMTARGKGKLAADYAMLLVVPVVLGQAIKNLIQPDAGDDELDPEALARKLAAEELSFLMGTMVIAREFGGAAQLLTGAEGVRMGYGGPAGLRAVGEVYGLATQAGQLEFDRAFRRSAINTLGAFTGLPSAQVNRTIDGIEAVIEGEVEGVGAVVAPLTGVQR